MIYFAYDNYLMNSCNIRIYSISLDGTEETEDLKVDHTEENHRLREEGHIAVTEDDNSDDPNGDEVRLLHQV